MNRKRHWATNQKHKEDGKLVDDDSKPEKKQKRWGLEEKI